jgi:hypothetical protein
LQRHITVEFCRLLPQRKARGWRASASIFAGMLFLLAPAHGQDDRLTTNPPLGQAFPIEAKAADVKLTCPVLLNSRTVLGPDVTLRFVYIDLSAGMQGHGTGGGAGSPGAGGGGGDSGGGHAHHGGGGGGPPDAGDDSSDSPSGAHVNDANMDPFSKYKATNKEFTSEVWHSVDLFQEALGQANDLGTMIVYSRPGQQKPQWATIDLPDGMLLGEVGGHVEVLALSADSEAGVGGLQAGDQIQSVGASAVTSLRQFTSVYFSVKGEARKSGQPYSLQVWRPDESRQLTIRVGAPPSLMHMF